MQSPEIGVCLECGQATERLLWLQQSDLWGEELKIRLWKCRESDCIVLCRPLQTSLSDKGTTGGFKARPLLGVKLST